MLVVFLLILVADTKTIYGYNFAAPLMSSNGMSTKENTQQLLPQFPSTRSSESELETEYSSFKKRRKHQKENT